MDNPIPGALAGQYVLGELKALGDMPIFYWAREGSAKAEVDFIIQSGNRVIPLEVKAERNLKAKSLKSFINIYKPPMAVRSSMADLGCGNYANCVIHDIPLYMISGLQSVISTRNP